jgi:undecaprenyl phosphate N,N'-diacetylbacillosamine 1-phosphate transferase
MYRKYVKRILDITLSILLFVILLPLLLVITVWLFVVNKGTPFFLQNRTGKGERIFVIIKFKTMNDKKDASGNLLHDAERLTGIGKFIRKTSLDEIPQLLNVIKGDMSLIGPRPLLPEYLPFYTPYHRRRHEIRPGITGLAQVSGRNILKFSKRFALDVQYVDQIGFLLDCKIIWRTIIKFFHTEDIIAGQTVEEVDDVGVSKALPAYHFKKNIRDATL